MTAVAPSDVARAARARAFVEDVLMPLEEKAERAGGRLPAEDVERIRSEALAAGLAGGLHAREHGGQGWTKLEWVLVEEQFGRVDERAVVAHPERLQRARRRAPPEQIDRYLRPGAARRAARRLRGHRGARGVRPVGHRDHRGAAATAVG